VRGHPAWRLTDALPALEGGRDEDGYREEADGGSGPEDPPLVPAPVPPPGYEVLERLEEPFVQGYVAAALELVYRLPRIVGAVAGPRVGMDAAFELSRDVVLLAMLEAGRAPRRWGVGPCREGEDPDVWAIAAFLPFDWRRVAREVGEPGWIPPHPIPGWPEIPEEGATAEASRRPQRGSGLRGQRP
jgi:hypothetical protein